MRAELEAMLSESRCPGCGRPWTGFGECSGCRELAAEFDQRERIAMSLVGPAGLFGRIPGRLQVGVIERLRPVWPHIVPWIYAVAAACGVGLALYCVLAPLVAWLDASGRLPWR